MVLELQVCACMPLCLCLSLLTPPTLTTMTAPTSTEGAKDATRRARSVVDRCSE